jgi:hypothetical protein
MNCHRVDRTCDSLEAIFYVTFIRYFHQYKYVCGTFYKRPQIIHFFNHLEINVQCVHKVCGSFDLLC